MNATEFFRGVIAELTKMGYNVRQQEGCWSRSNGSSWAHGMPVGHVNHHFVIPLSAPLANGVQNVTYGDSTLQGPKCNFYGGVDPRTGEKVITFISVGPSNNAGRGNLSVLNRVKADQQPVGWAALHGLPDDYLTANVNYAGVELHHPGDATPWPEKLIELAVDLNVAMCKVAGWSHNRCIMHAEHSSRKIDMSWHGPQGGFELRAKIAAKLSGTIPTPTPTPVPNPPTAQEEEDEDMYKLVRGDSGPNQGMVFAAGPGRFFHVADPLHYQTGVAVGMWKDEVKTLGLADLDTLRDICLSNGADMAGDKDGNIVGSPLPSDYVQGKV